MILSVILVSLLQTVYVSGVLEEALSHFEPLHSLHVTHKIVKRSLDTKNILERELEFDVLERHFHLKLKHKKPVIAAGFKVTAVNKYGTERDVTPTLDNFYHGFDAGYPGTSTVSLYFEDQDVITASIQTPGETYLIEPSWRHVPGSHNYSMIAYKRSDLNMEKDFGKKFCEGIHVEADTEHSDAIHEEDPVDVHRVKRQAFANAPHTPAINTCPLYLVADYRYFRNMGEGNIQKTTSYLLGLIDRIDNIYRETAFSYGFIGMGFEVKEIKIHEDPSTVAGPGVHYNEEKMSWDTKELLEVFSRNRNFLNFCLAHLFTHIPFSNGVLGLAYIGSPRTYSVGGVCSPVYYKGGRQLYLNTGWSSSVNRYNRSLLTAESLLVTAHEFGHNWGSEHDPDTEECSPSSFNGGKYIMYTYSVSGYDQNNKVFSNCSRRSMGAVLQYKAPLCFTEPSGSFCGNFRIEQGEECDAGPRGRSGNDRCCNTHCQLRYGAVCSDSNHECCLNCQYKPSTAVCQVEQEDSCEAEQHCDGHSATCPPPGFRPDNSSCLNRGKCRNGICLSFCESEGLHSCVCDNETESCFWCCKETPNSICKPHPNKYTLPNGTACVMGYCDEKGVCKKQEQDLIERIWQIIESITPDTVVQFMKANIVGTVLVFSLVIWIPASCYVCHLDRKRKREDEKHREWLRYDNRSLVLDEDQASGQVSIRHAGVRSRHGYQYVITPRTSVRTDTFI